MKTYGAGHEHDPAAMVFVFRKYYTNANMLRLKGGVLPIVHALMEMAWGPTPQLTGFVGITLLVRAVNILASQVMFIC